MINAVERWLVQGLENALNWPYNKPLQAVGLMPKPTAPSVKLSISLYTRNMFVSSAALVLLAMFALAFYFVYLMLDWFTLHQIERHYQAMLHTGYVTAKPDIFALCLIPFTGTFLYALFSFPQFWAWNRRADRLNREAKGLMPADVSDEMPGVWPPPPRTTL